MNIIKARSAPIFTNAGNEMIKANISFRIPLAPFIIRRTRPIRNTLATRNSVGEMDTFFKASSNPPTGIKMEKT